jgi:F-type H+-transporting ATPase subunit gamma
MANLKELRGRIKSVKTTQQMTRAMKMVAAAKLRRAQEAIIRLRPYAQKLKEIMDHIGENMAEGIDSPYTKPRTAEKVLMVVVTSNRGLCGPFNANVCKLAQQTIDEQFSSQKAAGNVEILCIGKKGFEYFKRRGYKVVGENQDVFASLSFDTVSTVCDMVMSGFLEGRWDKVELFFNEFKNVVVQRRTHEHFLPMTADLSKGDDHGGGSAKASSYADYIFEPDKKEILESMIPRSLKLQFYKAVLESNAGEQGARMTAMGSATDNAENLLKELRLNYNRERQAAITKEILEIVAGANALSAS